MKPIFPLLLAILPALVFSQDEDYTWWNNKHGWNGLTPWQQYLNISPAYMGPNALPVPDGKDGSIRTGWKLDLALDAHFGKGDQTQNIFGQLNVPLFSDRVSLAVSMVPVEHFQMDTLTRDLRRARERDGEGFATGDVYFSTLVQLLKEHPTLPDMAISINLRTASGSHLGAARFTDSPGYFFDLSFGKKMGIDLLGFHSIRPYGLAGFYVWQVSATPRQNDAVSYGGGFKLESPSWTFDHYVGGYIGYIGNGDNPMVYRMSLQTRHSKKINYFIRLQYGLIDFPYTSVRLGCALELDQVLGF